MHLLQAEIKKGEKNSSGDWEQICPEIMSTHIMNQQITK